MSVAWSLDARIAPARRADPPLDYCLWPYDPPALPGPGSWQSSALLYQSLKDAHCQMRLSNSDGTGQQQARAIVRQGIAVDETLGNPERTPEGTVTAFAEIGLE